MTELKFDPECEAVLKDVRNDQSSTSWAILTYKEGSMDTIVVYSKGNGSCQELIDQLRDDHVMFGLIRVTDQIDESSTVKFIFVNWCGDSVRRMLAARQSVQKGSITKFMTPFHIDHYCNSAAEISVEALMSKVQDASGSGNRVLDDGGASRATKDVRGGSRVAAGGGGSKEFVVADEAATRAAIARVRDNADAAQWVLCSFPLDGSPVLALQAVGEGEIDDLIAALDENTISYGLCRHTHTIDQSATVKFSFVECIGHGSNRMLRARVGTFQSRVRDLFGQAHVSHSCERRSEITREQIENKIGDAAGTRSHVHAVAASHQHTDTGNAAAAAPVKSNNYGGTSSAVGAFSQKNAATKAPTQAVPKTLDNSIKLDDETAIRAAIQSVRDDSNPTDWVLCSYVAGAKPDTLTLHGKGSGGVNELIARLDDTNVWYGLSRHVQQIDETSAVKFCFIQMTGPNCNRMLRARIATHKGAVNALFAPYHVDHHCESSSEVSEDIIKDKIGFASGTALHVK